MIGMNPFICISDCHLGYRHRFKVDRLRDYLRSFEEALNKALAVNPGILYFGGDVMHHPKPDPVSMRAVFKNLLKAAERTQVVVSIGNHEIMGHLGTTYSPLYSELHRNIHVLSTENPHVTLKISGRELVFTGFQYIRRRETAEELLAKISSEVDENKTNILCLHQAVEKYLHPYEISLRALREVAPKYDLIVLGHVHKHQRIDEVYDVTPAYYIGSTERISFNEWQNPSGFMVFRDLDFKNPDFVPVSSSPMRQVKEKIEGKKPEEINTRIESIIKENSDTKLLQINLDVDVSGDYLEIRQDWGEKFPDYTVLDVNVTPKAHEGSVQIEKLELSSDLIREYFEKTGRAQESELLETSTQLFEDYGR